MVSPHDLATICFWCSVVHSAGGSYVWGRGYRFPGICYLLSGAILLAFAVSIIRNGTPGG